VLGKRIDIILVRDEKSGFPWAYFTHIRRWKEKKKGGGGVYIRTVCLLSDLALFGEREEDFLRGCFRDGALEVC
jgi:hypothetical protein